MDFLECPNVFLENKGFMTPGKLKLTHEQIIFKNDKTGVATKISSKNFDEILFQHTGECHLLRVSEKDGDFYRFVGFNSLQKNKIKEFLKKVYQIEVKVKDLSTVGWNWGQTKFKGSSLKFKVNKQNAFEIPLQNVSQCASAKNEVTLEFHQNEDSPVSLSEIRFFIPLSDSNDDLVDSFRKRVLSQAKIANVSGDIITTFPEVQCVTPRGRYDLKIFQSFIQLHGKTFDFKIHTTSMNRLFLLPHKDVHQMYFIMNFNPPIRQGQTRYYFLVFVFNAEDKISVELPYTEEKIEKLYGDKLKKNMQGPLYDVVAQITKVIVNKRVIRPSNFVGDSGTSLIICSYKTAAGYLYPLDKGLLYLYKPPIYISFAEISFVNFARGETSTRSFDIEVEVQSGNKYVFSNINKEEYSAIFHYISLKKIVIKNKVKCFVNENTSGFGDLEDDLDDSKNENDKNSENSSDENFDPFTENESTDSNSSLEDEDLDNSSEISLPKTNLPKMKKSKKVIDKNKPKRPQTAFMIWLNENREKIKSKHPDMKVTEIAKEGGRLWKEMTDKTKWEKRAKEAKKDYEEAMKEYKAKTEDD